MFVAVGAGSSMLSVSLLWLERNGFIISMGSSLSGEAPDGEVGATCDGSEEERFSGIAASLGICAPDGASEGAD